MKENRTHLNEDQILLSLVDENDLSDDAKGHITACQVCREKKTALMSELENLGEIAKDFAPLTRKKPVLVSRKSWHSVLRRPMFASGFAVIFIAVCLLGLTLFIDSSKQITARLSTEAEEDMYLLEDILEKSALPEYYLDITVTSNNYFDDEFLEFITPMEEESNSV